MAEKPGLAIKIVGIGIVAIVWVGCWKFAGIYIKASPADWVVQLAVAWLFSAGVFAMISSIVRLLIRLAFKGAK